MAQSWVLGCPWHLYGLGEVPGFDKQPILCPPLLAAVGQEERQAQALSSFSTHKSLWDKTSSASRQADHLLPVCRGQAWLCTKCSIFWGVQASTLGPAESTVAGWGRERSQRHPGHPALRKPPEVSGVAGPDACPQLCVGIKPTSSWKSKVAIRTKP